MGPRPSLGIVSSESCGYRAYNSHKSEVILKPVVWVPDLSRCVIGSRVRLLACDHGLFFPLSAWEGIVDLKAGADPRSTGNRLRKGDCRGSHRIHHLARFVMLEPLLVCQIRDSACRIHDLACQIHDFDRRLGAESNREIVSFRFVRACVRAVWM